MNKIIYFLIMCFPFLFFSESAIAGCGEDKGQCYYYKAGELISQSQCKVTTCSAAVGYYYSNWEWDNGNTVSIELSGNNTLLVNGKPGFSSTSKFKDENLVCYGIKDSDELLCNDSDNQ
ncbi:secreted protein [Beggiatoa sp. PS]|nr:secreted protein [Beggiatoa sp. PS]